MTNLPGLTARETAAAIRAGEVSAAEVTEAALARPDEVGAFVRYAPELARAEAAEADRRLAAGEAAPLLGVPVPIKDLTMVAGVEMTAGSAALTGWIPPVDEGVVTLLRAAGSVMLGKTNTPEIGLPSYTEPDIAPPARTPWDVTRNAGGSSGGAAAAVAAGLVPMAHGNDGGGSIRIPAACCGLVGLKPSRGRISTGPYGIDGAALAANGVLTRDVRDTALALDILSAPWPGDDRALPRQDFLAACDVAPSGLRVGVVTTPFIAPDAPVHPEALAGVRAAVAALEELGHHVSEVGVPFPAEQWQPFKDVWSVMAASAPVPPELEERLVSLTRWMRERGRGVTGLAYAAAIANGQQLQRSAAAAWADVDIVLTPTLAQPAPLVGTARLDADPAQDFEDQCAFTPWTSTFNILGSPAITLPLHWAPAADGGPILPWGVQLAARTGREDQLLGLAAALEAARDWRHRRPPVFATA